MIPARIGSERLKFKNLALVNNRPLIYYSINTAKKSKIFTDIFINSDNKIFEKISKRYFTNFYLRKKKLGSSNTKSDDVVYDFLKNIECDILVWVNPISPLLLDDDIKKTVKYFIKNNYDSLITVSNKFAHSLINNKPINFKTNEAFKKTQELDPLQIMNYSLMMWRRNSFIRSYEKKGHALLNGNVGYYEISNHTQYIVKYADDLEIISQILKRKKVKKKYINVKYDSILKNYVS